MAENENENEKPEILITLESVKLSLPLVLFITALFFMSLWAFFPGDITQAIYALIILSVGAVFGYLTFFDVWGLNKDSWNFLPLLFALILVGVIYGSSNMLLSVLFSAYFLLSILFSGKVIKLQTAIIIAIAITAIMFRVYPAMDCGVDRQCPMPGHLASMDDPYFHYKQIERLYSLEDIPDRDLSIYPPEGRGTPEKFSYYYNVYMAHLTGGTIRDVTILYPVFISVLGAIMMFFLLRELVGDWKSGFLGGFLFATMPAILDKSTAGAIEEDLMGLVMGIFAMYLLFKAINSHGRKNLKFAVLSGFAFFLTLISWKGIVFLYAIPFIALALYVVGIWLISFLMFTKDAKKKLGSIATLSFYAILLLTVLSVIGLMVFMIFGYFDMLLMVSGALVILMALFSIILVIQNKEKKDINNLPKETLKYLKSQLWPPVSVAIIAGLIPILLGLIVLDEFSLTQVFPYLALVGVGILAETFRYYLLKTEDETNSLFAVNLPLTKDFFIQISIVILLAAVVFVFFIGIDTVTSVPQKTFEVFAGTDIHNFLVDKTIQEQAALSKGDLVRKLDVGYNRYWISELLTIVMIPLLFVLLVYYYFKNRERMFFLLRAYLVGLIFFLVAMNYVWIEARLTFSQSLGFLLLGAMVGILLPKNIKELQSIKLIPFLIIVVLIPITIFYHGIFFGVSGSAWDTQRPAGVSPAWFMGVKWLDNNIQNGHYEDGKYVNGDYVLTWWDYGHFITALSGATVITDPLQAKENYIMETARFFYNATREDEAMKWLMEQPWNTHENGDYKVKYIILDNSLVSKASALAFLGTNYYQVPNNHQAVNGVCDVGELCQNVEINVNGETLFAKKDEDGQYTCSQGVVCKGDRLARFDSRRCCKKEPTACCNVTYEWRDIGDSGGSPALFRSAQDPVYGQYRLTKNKIVCGRPEYTTSTEPFFLVVDGKRKTVAKSYLYSGNSALPYGDGVYYHAFVIYLYSDGTQDTVLISGNCEAEDANKVLSLGKDMLVPLRDGVRIGDDVVSLTYVHVAEKWLNNMFTQIYLLDAQNLKHINIIRDSDTNQFYPIVKIYKITYPDEIPDVSDDTSNTSSLSEIDDGVAKAGDKVSVNYIGSFENGTIFDTSIGRGPFEFTLGTGSVIPGFDKAVTGMAIGETKTVTILPEEAYGVNGTHRLAGKTLVFEITLLTINGKGAAEETPEKENVSALNLSFDYFDPALAEKYGIIEVPSIIWNCQYFKKGLVFGDLNESEALRILTCAITQAKPEDVCSGVGVVIDPEKGVVYTDAKVKKASAYLKQVKGAASCAEQNTTKIQVFYGKDCANCADQKKDLDSLKAQFGDLIDISYYCVGDEQYCTENSATTI